MIGEVIFQLLTSNPEFSALAGDRVYPLRIAQSVALPAVAYQTISNVPTHCKEGDARQDAKRVQLNIYALDYDQQEALAEVCRSILGDFSGNIEGNEVANITYQTETDLHDDAAEIFFKAQDYIITINR